MYALNLFLFFPLSIRVEYRHWKSFTKMLRRSALLSLEGHTERTTANGPTVAGTGASVGNTN